MILICVLSRAIAIPIYLRQLGFIGIDPVWDGWLNQISKGLLMLAGVAGVAVILYNVFVAFRRQNRIRRSLAGVVTAPAAPQ